MNRKYSLKSNHEIENLVKARKSVGNKYYAIYYDKSYNELAQIAISPTKRFKTAANRNYEKRVTKEIIREILDDFKYIKLLIVVKVTTSDLKFEERKKQILYLIRKIIKENS